MLVLPSSLRCSPRRCLFRAPRFRNNCPWTLVAKRGDLRYRNFDQSRNFVDFVSLEQKEIRLDSRQRSVTFHG